MPISNSESSSSELMVQSSPIKEESKESMESEEGLSPKVTTINNKEEINSTKNASIGEKTSLRVGAEHVAAKVNQLLQNLDRASRSNDPPECSDPECMMYGKNNNKFSNYNARKKKTRCYICGDCDHEGWLCKKVTDCFICSKKGHLVMDCPNRNVEVDLASRLCLKCGNTGHDMFSCVDNYDSKDLKAIECYICRKAGHLCCAGDKTILIGASCYNCGNSGHYGWECTKPNGVAYRSGPFCEKCETRGHHTRLSLHKKQVKTAAEKATERRAKRATPANVATDKAAARRAKRKARRARKLNTTVTTPIVNPNPNQPNGLLLPAIMGSNYGQPGSKIPPPASNCLGPLPNGPGPLPSHQQHINDQLGTHVPNPLSPPTQFPHNSSPNFQNSPQFTQIPFNQETQNIAPPGTEIRRPVVQPPILTQFSPDKKQVKTAAEKAPERTTPANTATNKAAARSAKRKARRARKLNTTDKMPIVNPNPNQPNSLPLPPIVGSNYEQPGSKIPPPASNGPSPLPNGPVPLPNGPGPLPNGPGPLPSHQEHINDQLGTHVPNSLSPPTQFPHNSSPNFQNRPQITQIPLNQETRNMAPPGTRRPVVQPPSLTQFSPDKKQMKTVPEKATERRIKRATQANAGSDEAASRSTKRKAQGARKLNTSYTTPIVNPNPNQPNCWRLSPIVGSYYGQPGPKIPPPATSDRGPLPNGPGPLPFHQQHINYQLGTHVPNYFSPPTQFSRNFYPSFQDRPQITQIPFNQETRNMAPSGTEIRRPVVQPPVLTQFSRVIQNNPQHLPSHQLPWTETRVPLNSTVLPTQFPHVFQSNPSQPFSHQTVIAPSSMGSQYPQQYRPGNSYSSMGSQYPQQYPPRPGNSCSSMGSQYPQQYPPRPVIERSSIGSQYSQQYPPQPVIVRSSVESQYLQQYPPRPVISRSSMGSQYPQQYPPRPGWTF